ncbi:hypothetical protein FPV67DRAFT_1682460 [Lyophyllum atratum]|nr:hypothetical protein FPV67DRAFT_1682460 [Lyophyllum atratum]
MGARRVKAGDAVKVVAGQSMGAVGVIQNIINDDAVVFLQSRNLLETCPVISLRKHIRIGDEVQVVLGPHAGFEGWVTSLVDDSLLIHDHKAFKEVVVRSDCVNFQEASFITVDRRFFVGSEVVVTKGEYVGAQGRVLSSTRETVLLHDRKGQKAVEAPLECVQLAASAAVTDIKTRTGKDPNYHLIGQHVRVIKDNIFKDYEAIIKSTENHNFVSIEIQATMRRQRIQLSHLCLLSDPQMQPLDAESSLQKTVTRDGNFRFSICECKNVAAGILSSSHRVNAASAQHFRHV